MIEGSESHQLECLIIRLFMLQTMMKPISIIVFKCNCVDTINLYDALKRMRELTRAGIPFSFQHISCNLTKNYSDGLIIVDKALLRTGLSRDYSDKSEILIGYTIEPTQEPRWFYLPLLTKFNGIPVVP